MKLEKGAYHHEGLKEAVAKALEAQGMLGGPLSPSALSALDEFHVGGRPATLALAERLELAPGVRLLDVGCGLGGPARLFVEEYGCRVTGIDRTEAYLEVAAWLTELCGLSDYLDFRCADARALPFGAASFDAATLLHVGMNVADKEGLFREVARVLTPGGRFGLYEIMRLGDKGPEYPVPWANEEAESHLATPEDYRAALEAAGFEILTEVVRREEALAFIERTATRLEQGSFPKLSLELVMGESLRPKVANLRAAVESGEVAPLDIIAVKRP
jgi:SAM-dependent methyltransferase